MASLFTEDQIEQLLAGDELSDDLKRLLRESREHRAEAIRLLGAMRLVVDSVPRPAKDLLGAWIKKGKDRDLAERLSVGRSRVGASLAASGMGSFRRSGRAPVAAHLGPKQAPEVAWAIPVPEVDCQLMLTIRSVPKSDLWELKCHLESEKDPDINRKATIVVRHEDEIPVLSGALVDYLQEPIVLAEGVWEVSVEVGQDRRIVSLELKSGEG